MPSMRLMDMFKQVSSAIFGDEEALKNRRRVPRIVCDLEVSCLDETGNWQARVTDMGIQGIRVAVPKAMKKGHSLLLSALPGTTAEGRPDLRCLVSWCRRDGAGLIHTGLHYDDSPENIARSWVHYYLLARHYPTSERHDRRVEAGLPIEVRQKGVEGTFPGLLLDLSLGGAKIRVEHNLAAESPLLMRFGGGKSKFNPVKLQAQIVGTPQEGQIYSLKFFPSDRSEKRRLRRVLLTLLSGLRTDTRPKAASVRSDPRPTASDTPRERPGRSGGLGKRKRVEPRPEGSVSRFLQTPVSGGLEAAVEPELSPRVRELLAEPESGKPLVRGLAVPARSFMQGWTGVDLPEVELARGWAPIAFGESLKGSVLPDLALRPTEEFFAYVHPAMPGCSVLCALLLDALPCSQCGALGVATRYGLSRLVQNHRRPLPWLASTIKTRERLERRALTLDQRTFHYLALLGLGGVASIKSALVCAQISTILARELGLDDPVHLEQLRMAAMLKDVGEILIYVGLEGKSFRDRVSLFLHGLDSTTCPLEFLSLDWPIFRCPNEIQINRQGPGRLSNELRMVHPLWSEQILSDQGYPEWLLGLVRWHHEAMNGSGYPDGLQGEEIPWVARCVAVADAFSSLLGEGHPVPQAMGLIERGSGQLFDPVFVESLHEYLGKMQLL
jgi:hypothetical protein